MRQTIFSFIILSILLTSCNGQIKTDPKKLYNEDFKWTIVIPENFNIVSPDDWAKMQNKGADAIENTYGEEVINQAKTIFVFKNADFNYLESNYQPFDTEVDGDYLESCKNVNEILYETFKTQMPNAVIDSSRSVEKISGLDFQTFKMKIDFPNGMIMHSLMYSRLFDKNEFSVNIMYVDDKQGEKMLNAWTNSRFE
ncbi:MAG: hypothetical protein AB8E82_06055 [Aureispira sp.]